MFKNFNKPIFSIPFFFALLILSHVAPYFLIEKPEAPYVSGSFDTLYNHGWHDYTLVSTDQVTGSANVTFHKIARKSGVYIDNKHFKITTIDVYDNVKKDIKPHFKCVKIEEEFATCNIYVHDILDVKIVEEGISNVSVGSFVNL